MAVSQAGCGAVLPTMAGDSTRTAEAVFPSLFHIKTYRILSLWRADCSPKEQRAACAPNWQTDFLAVPRAGPSSTDRAGFIEKLG